MIDFDYSCIATAISTEHASDIDLLQQHLLLNIGSDLWPS